MIMHLVEQLSMASGEMARDSIGGRPILPVGVSWPTCACGRRMTLFFQFDVREGFALPFVAGSHLCVFMCPVHNDAPEMLNAARQLRQRFWDRRRRIDGSTRFYELYLHRPGSSVSDVVHPPDEILRPKQLRFVLQDEVADDDAVTLRAHEKYAGVSLSLGEVVGGVQGFKVGGQPAWAQAPEVHRCCCGAQMLFVCQVPLDWPFAKLPGAPEQPDSSSSDDYCLFLGNETYVFACEAQCDPRAVHVVVQN
jgi:hypothetical protein